MHEVWDVRTLGLHPTRSWAGLAERLKSAREPPLRYQVERRAGLILVQARSAAWHSIQNWLTRRWIDVMNLFGDLTDEQAAAARASVASPRLSTRRPWPG